MSQVPAGVSWPALQASLRKKGVSVGGSYGAYTGRVLRLGHMGTQAHDWIVDGAIDALLAAVQELSVAPSDG